MKQKGENSVRVKCSRRERGIGEKVSYVRLVEH